MNKSLFSNMVTYSLVANKRITLRKGNEALFTGSTDRILSGPDYTHILGEMDTCLDNISVLISHRTKQVYIYYTDNTGMHDLTIQLGDISLDLPPVCTDSGSMFYLSSENIETWAMNNAIRMVREGEHYSCPLPIPSTPFLVSNGFAIEQLPQHMSSIEESMGYAMLLYLDKKYGLQAIEHIANM